MLPQHGPKPQQPLGAAPAFDMLAVPCQSPSLVVFLGAAAGRLWLLWVHPQRFSRRRAAGAAQPSGSRSRLFLSRLASSFTGSHGSEQPICSLPSARKASRNQRWRRPRTEAMGFLLDSVTANARLARGQCWAALARRARGKARPVSGRACLWAASFPAPE